MSEGENSMHGLESCICGSSPIISNDEYDRIIIRCSSNDCTNIGFSVGRTFADSRNNWNRDIAEMKE